MDWNRVLSPIEPVVFRDACIGLFEYASEWVEEHEEPFDLALGGAMFLMNSFDARNGTPEAQDLYLSASMRIFELHGLMRKHGVELGELCRTSSDGKAREVHYALLEAAAVAPMREGKFDLQEILAEARARTTQMDELDRLFESGKHS